MMSQFTPEQLHDPSVGAYYGILLAAAMPVRPSKLEVGPGAQEGADL